MNIVPSKQEDRIERFECEAIDGPSFQIVANKYVIAMGGIENPRILLASKDRSRSGVANENGLVGRYFMQHPHYSAKAYLIIEDFDRSFYHPHSTTTYDEQGDNGKQTTVRGALSLEPEQRKKLQLPNTACTVHEVDSSGTKDEFREIGQREIAGLSPFLSDNSNLYMLRMVAEQTPLKESRVKLGNDRDSLGIPRVTVDWRVSQADLRKYKEFLRTLGTELAEIGRGRMWTQLDENGEFTTSGIWGGGHHMGTTRMSSDPSAGVVNPNCRTHTLSNLYIAGSSVFPTAGYANPTLTIVALAHRLADHLAEEM